MEKAKVKPEQALMEAIGFTEEDLEANRQKYMSKRQRVILYARVKKLTRIIAVIVILLLVIDCVTLFSDFYGDSFSVKLEYFFFITLIGLCPIGFVYIKRRRYKLDLRNEALSSVKGNLKLTYFTSRGYESYTAKIDKTWFDINRKMFLALKNFERVEPDYIIYFVPHSKTILSAEWLREE